MSHTTPINDLVLVELEQRQYGQYSVPPDPDKSITTGKLLAVSDRIYFLSSFSYVLEDSFKHPEKLEELRQYWNARVGQTIRWEERADKGMTFEENGKRYACIKITKLIGEVK